MHEALKLGQPNSEFDPITVSFLLNKFDSNHDNEINFDEFYNLFVSVTNQYNEFLDIDRDSSGYIDAHELGESMRQKGFSFTSNFYQYLCGEIGKIYMRPNNGITFDLYVRIKARFDYLKEKFARINNFARQSQYNNSLEKFMGHNFFS